MHKLLEKSTKDVESFFKNRKELHKKRQIVKLIISMSDDELRKLSAVIDAELDYKTLRESAIDFYIES